MIDVAHACVMQIRRTGVKSLIINILRCLVLQSPVTSECLCVSRRTIVGGGLSIECDAGSRIPDYKEKEEVEEDEEEDEELPPRSDATEQYDSSTEDDSQTDNDKRDGCLGSRLFIDYLHRLVSVQLWCR